MALTVGGLFSGIGGWELGLERAGMEIAWHCDSDPFCRRVLVAHRPNVPCYEDVRVIGGNGCREPRIPVPHVDVLCGGFPCQDISDAGKRAGIKGERSGLWTEFHRLIREMGPRYALVENVRALTRRGLDVVLGDLASIGFDAEWTALRASDFGAPHPRDRLWLVAYPAGRDGSSRDLLGAGEDWRSPLTVRGLHGLEMAPGWQPRGFWSASEPPSPLLVDGIPKLAREVAAYGNALVPQIAEWIGRRIIEWEAADAT